ncbi:RDD family protein [Aeromicrobium sp. NPDC092404]|uniref:RDD family protein n=1 Tax=Aeromicrobium sp. NPDC092404 TaxID=3154976 RepID=UPI003423A9CD
MTEHESSSQTRLAPWHERVLAYLVDVAPLVALFVVLGLVTDDPKSYAPIGIQMTLNSSSSSFMISGVTSLVYLAITLVWFGYNWLRRQGSTGQTMGKKVMGIAVQDAARQPIGAGLTFARQLAHVLDLLPCFLGYLWPLWDREKRTFADMIMQTRVHRV